MKKLIFLLFLISSASLASGYGYRMNTDGFSRGGYVGECLLHEDYQGVEYTAVEVVPYINDPSKSFLENLKPPFAELIKRTCQYESFCLEYHRYEKEWEEDGYFDDISIDVILFPRWKTGTLYRVSYGVGGGNGGYMIFSITPDSGSQPEGITLVASTFDGDLLNCHKWVMDMGSLSLDPVDLEDAYKNPEVILKEFWYGNNACLDDIFSLERGSGLA